MDTPSDRQGVPLLKTKLYIPPVRPRERVVPRPRLIEQLSESLGSGHKLTLVSAPAGFGKTTLLGEWVQHIGRPAAWLSLDSGDDDVGRFWRYVIAALQTVEGRTGEAAQAMLQGMQSQQLVPSALLAALINDIASLSTPFVLVLDDYHAIVELAVHESVGFLLEHQPPHMHLVMATREDPPLPLSRLRARGQMTELRASDLRFTQAEAAHFLNRAMKLDLSPEDVAALENRTEGWIVGLQMAALSMRGRKDASEFVRTFSGSHRFILDYLVEEVLDRQPAAVQDFLLKTSILEQMTGSLCDYVTGGRDSQAVLTQLEQANLFLVPLDDARRWRFMRHLLSLREAFPAETWERVTRHASFHLHTASPWRALDVRVRQRCAALRARGVGPGDVVALCAREGLAAAELLHAAAGVVH